MAGVGVSPPGLTVKDDGAEGGPESTGVFSNILNRQDVFYPLQQLQWHR